MYWRASAYWFQILIATILFHTVVILGSTYFQFTICLIYGERYQLNIMETVHESYVIGVHHAGINIYFSTSFDFLM